MAFNKIYPEIPLSTVDANVTLYHFCYDKPLYPTGQLYTYDFNTGEKNVTLHKMTSLPECNVNYTFSWNLSIPLAPTYLIPFEFLPQVGLLNFKNTTLFKLIGKFYSVNMTQKMHFGQAIAWEWANVTIRCLTGNITAN